MALFSKLPDNEGTPGTLAAMFGALVPLVSAMAAALVAWGAMSSQVADLRREMVDIKREMRDSRERYYEDVRAMDARLARIEALLNRSLENGGHDAGRRN